MRDLSIIGYDIRGRFGREINIDYAKTIGQKFLQYTKAKNIIIGYDNRFSSPILEKALISGIKNCNIAKLGLCTSPMLYFASKRLKSGAGIMITASHNPIFDNGFKLLNSNLPLCGKELRNMLNTKLYKVKTGDGIVTHKDIAKEYVEDLFIDYTYKKKLRILWNPGSCTTSSIIHAVVDNMPEHEHIIIGSSISNYTTADPTKEHSLKHSIKLLKENNCDVCFAFDTDGDRICIIDHNENILSSSQILMIFIKYINNLNGSTVIVDVKISDKVAQMVQELGGTCIISPTGHSFIKHKIHKTGAIISGDGSGHIFFGEKGYDDGLYTAIKFISILSKNGWKTITNKIPKIYIASELRIKVNDRHNFVHKIKQYLICNHINFDNIDGVKVRVDGGWWLVRASNTEDVIVICCEGNSREKLKEIQSNVYLTLKKYY